MPTIQQLCRPHTPRRDRPLPWRPSRPSASWSIGGRSGPSSAGRTAPTGSQPFDMPPGRPSPMYEVAASRALEYVGRTPWPAPSPIPAVHDVAGNFGTGLLGDSGRDDAGPDRRRPSAAGPPRIAQCRSLRRVAAGTHDLVANGQRRVRRLTHCRLRLGGLTAVSCRDRCFAIEPLAPLCVRNSCKFPGRPRRVVVPSLEGRR